MSENGCADLLQLCAAALSAGIATTVTGAFTQDPSEQALTAGLLLLVELIVHAIKFRLRADKWSFGFCKCGYDEDEMRTQMAWWVSAMDVWFDVVSLFILSEMDPSLIIVGSYLG
eukprot:99825_1